MVRYDGEHIDVVTSFNTAPAGRQPRKNAHDYKTLALPPPPSTQHARVSDPAVRRSTRTVAIKAREEFERRVRRCNIILLKYLFMRKEFDILDGRAAKAR